MTSSRSNLYQYFGLLHSITLICLVIEIFCIKEGLIPSIYYEKTEERLHSANGMALQITYQLSNAYICNQGYYFQNLL